MLIDLRRLAKPVKKKRKKDERSKSMTIVLSLACRCHPCGGFVCCAGELESGAVNKTQVTKNHIINGCLANIMCFYHNNYKNYVGNVIS